MIKPISHYQKIGESFNTPNFGNKKVCHTVNDENARPAGIRQWSADAKTYGSLTERPSVNKSLNVEKELALMERKLTLNQEQKHMNELRKQMSEKVKRLQAEMEIDLSRMRSGYPIGEVDQGINVRDVAKVMKIKERGNSAKTNGRSENIQTERSEFGKSLRGEKRHFEAMNKSMNMSRVSVSNGFGNVSHVGQIIPEDMLAGTGTSRSNLKVSFGGLPSGRPSSRDSVSSRFQVQRANHKKLKEYIEKQNKRSEDYTKKFLKDQESRKRASMESLQAEMKSFRENRTRAVLSNKEEEKKKNIGMRFPSSDKPRPNVDPQSDNMLREIARSYKRSVGKGGDKKVRSDKSKENGSLKRVLDNTVKQLLVKKGIKG